MNDPQVTQQLRFGSIAQQRDAAADTMFANTGRRLYVIGDIDGQFRPRSNPYDLYSLGHPNPSDPLANKLQGVWAQPVRGFSGYDWALEWAHTHWELNHAHTFTQRFASAEWDYAPPAPAALRVQRQDWAALDAPVLFSRLSVSNDGPTPLEATVIFTAHFALDDAWFTQLAAQRNDGHTLHFEQDMLSARALAAPERWAAAVGSLPAPQLLTARTDGAGEMRIALHIPAHETRALTLALAVVSEGGAAAACQWVSQSLPQADALLDEKQAAYGRILTHGPRLRSPDAAFNDAFTLAQANLLMLEAETADLGRYCYAGLEMFPFWFSCDGAYSAPGLLSAGQIETVKNHVALGARFQEAGRVPHQLSPAGHTAFAGNAEETPLWVMSLYDVYRWTGDRAWLQTLYPAALRGLFDYTLGTLDPDGDGYASGPGMVEVEGMGEEKLDTAAYTWAALGCLAELADALQDAPNAARARAAQARIAAHFEADWWDETHQTYVMSLDAANQQYPVAHWAVVTPLEVGLAAPEHAAAALETLRQHYLNAWGLKHTAGDDERVWTLPTAALSRAAYRYGASDLGFAMLRCISQTLEHGPIGMFHELIPQGACFVQLWSAATFVRGVVEDIFGWRMRADLGQTQQSAPALPPGWQDAGLERWPQ